MGVKQSDKAGILVQMDLVCSIGPGDVVVASKCPFLFACSRGLFFKYLGNGIDTHEDIPPSRHQ